MAEVAVATHTKGRNLAPYHRVRHGDLSVLVAPGLINLAPAMRISTKRSWLTRGFEVEFAAVAAGPEADAC